MGFHMWFDGLRLKYVSRYALIADKMSAFPDITYPGAR